MKNIAFIMSHPRHELRIFRFLELYHLRVYVLTGGSDWNNHARLPSTEIILKEANCEIGNAFGRFTDKEIYQLILERRIDPFYRPIDEILADIKAFYRYYYRRCIRGFCILKCTLLSRQQGAGQKFFSN